MECEGMECEGVGYGRIDTTLSDWIAPLYARDLGGKCNCVSVYYIQF